MIAQSEILSPIGVDTGAAATDRVERYLRAHGVSNSRQVSRLAADVVAIARARHQPGVEPIGAAMETLEACLAAWFARLLPSDNANQAQVLTRGRVALGSGEVSARWPEYFLHDGALLAELIQVMRETELGHPPEIRLSHMSPPKVTAVPVAWPWWQASYRWPFQRVSMVWRTVASFIGAAFTGGS